MKLLLWAAIIFGVIWVLRNKAKAAKARMNDAAPPTYKAPVAPGETMLSCAHCGIHFPSSEAAIDAQGTVFCSAEHRQLHVIR